MKKITAFMIFGLISCASDHKQETITTYIKYVKRIQSDDELSLLKLEEQKPILGKDSVAFIINEYTKDASPLPVDTALARIAEDIQYNTKLLEKTTRRIDSLEKEKKMFPDAETYKVYVKSFSDLKDFTATQIEELKYMQYALGQYHKNEEDIFSRPVVCEYQVKGRSSDKGPKKFAQTFYLSPDTRRIYLVK